MHIKRRFKIFIALIALLYLVSTIQSTYAKYATNAEASTNISIAKWNIMVNNQDIKNNSNFSRTIRPTFNGNEMIKDDVIAPTSTGYFEVVVNGSDTDVAYQYNLTANQAIQNTVLDFYITKYTINDDPTEYPVSNGMVSIIKTVGLNETNKTDRYRFYVEWFEGDGEALNNESDTAQTKDGVALYNINLNVIQVAHSE